MKNKDIAKDMADAVSRMANFAIKEHARALSITVDAAVGSVTEYRL